MAPRGWTLALIGIVLFAVAALPASSPTSAQTQVQTGKITLTAASNSTSLGKSLDFVGTLSGLNSSKVTYFILGPDGSSLNGTLAVTNSAFAFRVSFNATGQWEVFCVAGNASQPEALSGLLSILVGEAVPTEGPTYFGIPLFVLGVVILLVTGVSLIYLVFAIRKRSREEAKGSGPSTKESRAAALLAKP
jgi:hypothetical protein